MGKLFVLSSLFFCMLFCVIICNILGFFYVTWGISLGEAIVAISIPLNRVPVAGDYLMYNFFVHKVAMVFSSYYYTDVWSLERGGESLILESDIVDRNSFNVPVKLFFLFRSDNINVIRFFDGFERFWIRYFWKPTRLLSNFSNSFVAKRFGLDIVGPINVSYDNSTLLTNKTYNRLSAVGECESFRVRFPEVICQWNGELL